MLTNQARGEIMFYDYDSMFDRTLKMRSDINLFKNSDYIGFVTPETIEEYFDEYYKIAIEKAKDISWNYVILYAVLEYGMENQTIISAYIYQVVHQTYPYQFHPNQVFPRPQ